MRSMFSPVARGAMATALAAVAPRHPVEALNRQRSATIAPRELQSRLQPATLNRHGGFIGRPVDRLNGDHRRRNPFSAPAGQTDAAAMLAALLVAVLLVGIVLAGLAHLGALK
jgi:hypothetical protein